MREENFVRSFGEYRSIRNEIGVWNDPNFPKIGCNVFRRESLPFCIEQELIRILWCANTAHFNGKNIASGDFSVRIFYKDISTANVDSEETWCFCWIICILPARTCENSISSGALVVELNFFTRIFIHHLDVGIINKRN